MDNGYTFYTGLVDISVWDKIWKNKNLVDTLTNVTTDYDSALGFSWDDESVVKISNIPLDAIKAYRSEDYADDDDFEEFSNDKEKINMLKHGDITMFLLDLLKYKDVIKTEYVIDE